MQQLDYPHNYNLQKTRDKVKHMVSKILQDNIKQYISIILSSWQQKA